MPIVKVDNLHKSFGGVAALGGVNLTVERGEAFCVLGPDGAGKTTLLRIMAGVMAADSGQTGILNHYGADEVESAKQYIGYLSQRFSLYSDLTVAENIDFYRRLFKIGKKEGEQRKSRLLEFSRLGPYVNRRAKHLSGGMKQKLALSCALIHTPQILILDEPTTGVDPISRREFWKILYDFLAEGLTIVLATPYMDEAERASRVALLYDGKIINCDTPENLKKLFRYQLAELVSDDNRLARQLLRGKFGQESVVFFGDKLHLKVENYEADCRLIKQIILEAGINIISLEQIAPGMEDVFVDAIT